MISMRSDVSIIIVNFNTSELLKKCLVSLEKNRGDLSLEIIVIDNNSQDDSREMLHSQFPYITTVFNCQNHGFAAANNQGLKHAESPYILLLNPDTEVCPGALEILKHFMDSHPEAGAVGPRTFLDHRKTLEVCSLKILTPERAACLFTSFPLQAKHHILQEITEIDAAIWEAEQPTRVEGIGGAAFFTRKQIMDSIGGLDERFFMGYEDTDLCMALHQAGKGVYFHPEAEIIHLFGQSKKLPEAPKQAMYSWRKTPLLFLRKYYGTKAVMKLHYLKIAGKILASMRNPEPIQAVEFSATDDISISWKQIDPAENGFLFEMSNDETFYDKFSARLNQNRFIIPAETMARLGNGPWHWRIFSRPILPDLKICAAGTFRIRETRG